MNPPAAARLQAQRRGVWAERAAAAWLRLKGYRVLARGYRSRLGEIDIVARRGNTLAFIEVKYRADATAAAEAIDWRKRGRLEGGARAWLAAHPAEQARDMRFDAVLVTPWRAPAHMENAWLP